MKYSNEVLAFFRTAAVANIADAMGSFGILDAGIQSMVPGTRLLGPARTAKCYPGSIITVHKALLEAEPGDVIVADGEGDERGALFGEIMALDAKSAGLAGVVIDGAVRDTDGLTDLEFPAYARAVNPRVGWNRRVGETNVAITCGGVIVNPGDLVVGDDDGVVVIPQARVEEIMEKVKGVQKKEAELVAKIKQGNRVGDLLGFRQTIYGS